MKLICFCFFFMATSATVLPKAAPARLESVLRYDWKFTRADDAAFSRAEYDDSGWQTVAKLA